MGMEYSGQLFNRTFTFDQYTVEVTQDMLTYHYQVKETKIMVLLGVVFTNKLETINGMEVLTISYAPKNGLASFNLILLWPSARQEIFDMLAVYFSVFQIHYHPPTKPICNTTE